MTRPRRLATLASLAVLRALAPLGGPAAQGLPDHSVFSAVLRAHVRGGRVDYAARQNDPARLRLYLDDLAAASPAALAQADRQTRLAFWINAYNGCMLKQVIEHYPIERAPSPRQASGSTPGRPGSVRDISGVFKRKHCQLAGALRSQDDIEHGILRPMGDARIHFAVNCAARSCPALAAEAYVPERGSAARRRSGSLCRKPRPAPNHDGGPPGAPAEQDLGLVFEGLRRPGRREGILRAIPPARRCQ